MAPANSKIPATSTACFSESAFEPTEVAKELATSLAPIPHATKNARKMEHTKTATRNQVEIRATTHKAASYAFG
jgi:hypothetical protein